MIRQCSRKWVLPFVTAALLVTLAPVGSSAYSQRRTSRKPQTQQTTRTRQTVQPPTVYERGYLKAYNEGFGQGQLDWGQSVPRDFQHSRGYQQRERSYDQGMAASEEYAQGYQLGFEMGYTDGYYGRARNLVIPANAVTLAKAASLADAQRAAERTRTEARPAEQREQRDVRNVSARSYSPVSIPNDTELFLTLTSSINTKTNRTGDRFTAAVRGPAEFEGATVEGHIATLNRSGRVSGKTELVLAFDRITLRDGRQGPLNADLEKILDTDKVRKVDREGRIETGNRTHEAEVRGGAGAGAGALVGALAGGGKGALVGLLVGGAAGVGTVYVEGNNDLILDNGSEVVIRTAGRRQP
jgi:hypothetical protein